MISDSAHQPFYFTFAFAEWGDDGDLSTVPDLVSISSSDSEGDDESFSSSSSKRGVSFSSTVEVKTIPNAKSYPSSQRRRMYASPSELRQNKIRNEKEFRYDGYDWRNATEENDMDVDALTGELVHPAHERSWDLERTMFQMGRGDSRFPGR